MNRLEEILTIMSEECGEIIVEISKYKRFGDQVYNGKTSLEKLQLEIGDFVCMLELLHQEGLLDLNVIEKQIAAKKEKLKKWSNLYNEQDQGSTRSTPIDNQQS